MRHHQDRELVNQKRIRNKHQSSKMSSSGSNYFYHSRSSSRNYSYQSSSPSRNRSYHSSSPSRDHSYHASSPSRDHSHLPAPHPGTIPTISSSPSRDYAYHSSSLESYNSKDSSRYPPNYYSSQVKRRRLYTEDGNSNPKPKRKRLC